MPYQGLSVPLALGLEGLTGLSNVAAVRPTQLIEALNITFEDGTIQKEGGATHYASVMGGPSLLGGWDWWPFAGAQRTIIYTSHGDLWKDSGELTFPVALRSALSTTAVPQFVEAGKEAAATDRKLFIFTGANPVQVLAGDGATTTDLATPPADWSGVNQPLCGANHERRLWGAGNANDPHRVYGSTPDNHEDFTGAGAVSLAVFPGEGEGISGLLSYKGVLIVWKQPQGIYTVDTRDAAVASWRVDRLSLAFGAPGPRAMAMVDNDVLFVDQHGNVNALSAVQEFGNLGGTSLSQVADIRVDEYLQTRLNFARLRETRALYYPAKKEAHFALAAAGSSVLNRRLSVDFRSQTPRFRFADRDVNQDLWLRRDAEGTLRPAMGDATGNVWLLDQAERSKGDTAYTGLFQTPHMDGAHLDPAMAWRRKNGAFLTLTLRPQDVDTTLEVDVFWDEIYSETLYFQAGLSGVPLGEFTLDVDRLGPLVTARHNRRRLRGSGVRVSFKVRQSGLGQSFRIAQMVLAFTVASERPERNI